MTETIEQAYLEVASLNLPNHSNELSNADDVIVKIKENVNQIIKSNSIDDTTHDKYYEGIVQILAYVGDLSKPLFNILDDLELMYTMKYIKAPELSKKLWLEHYDELHHPYSILKNRCFKMLEDIDEAYITKFKCYPPNWDI